MQTHASILIERPLHEVFAFVSDPANEPRWHPEVLSASVVGGGPLGPGSRIHAAWSARGRSGSAELEVTEFVPDERITLRTTAAPRAHASYAMHPDGDATRLSVSGTIELGGFAALAGGAIARALDAELAASLKRLKSILER